MHYETEVVVRICRLGKNIAPRFAHRYYCLLYTSLQGVLKESFVRLPYTEGIKRLEEAVAKGHKFEFPVYWGVDLASEHERYLCLLYTSFSCISGEGSETRMFFFMPIPPTDRYTHCMAGFPSGRAVSAG